MCLTIPKQVLSVKNGVAMVKSRKGKEEVGMIVKIKKGDWVLTQNNIIIRKITEKQAKEISDLFKQPVCLAQKGGK